MQKNIAKLHYFFSSPAVPSGFSSSFGAGLAAGFGDNSLTGGKGLMLGNALMDGSGFATCGVSGVFETGSGGVADTGADLSEVEESDGV